MAEAKSNLDVLVLGHRIAYWLRAFVESVGLLDNLERLDHTCTVCFMGRRGASFKTGIVLVTSHFKYNTLLA